MNIASKIIGLAAVCIGLAACNGTGAGAADSSVLATPVAAATPAVVQAAPPPPPPAPKAPDFSYSGELTQGGWIKGTVPDGTVSATLGKQPLSFDDKGLFFAAFDRDSAASVTLSATLSDGSLYSERVAVSPRKWNIQRVNTNRGRGSNLEAYWKKREPEHNAIVAARAKETGAQGWKQEFVWPVKGRISGKFGRQRIYRDEPGSYHSGLDIAPGHGVPFVSPADGVVVLARKGFSFEGTLVIIDHGAGLNSAFIHASKLAVSAGQTVKRGQYIGNVGSTGRATGPHLHWSLKWNDARIDPLLLLGPQ